MEKFRAFLEVVKKYHFWILCGLIVALSFGSWSLAINSEQSGFNSRKKVIQTKISQVQAITNNKQHPSEAYNQQIKDITKGPLTEQVERASKRLYEEQQSENPLPAVFARTDEQKDFEVAFFKIWGPMETIADLPPGTLGELYRGRYRDRISEVFPTLFQLIERRTEGASGGIVDWKDADQKKDSFLKRYTTGLPTTLDVMMAQEDFWIYETLLKVVRNTNDTGSDPKHDLKNYKKPANHKEARIKEILAMDIGKDAVDSWTKSQNSVFKLATDAPAPAANATPTPTAPTQTAQASVGRPGGPATASSSSGPSPLSGRYLDDKGKPLSDPKQQPYGEFRMMPVDLQVVIEQKEIPRLLAECAIRRCGSMSRP